MIWFLAPTVSLCLQQYEYIDSQLAAVQVRFLSGADGVDRWSEQSLWDGILKNVKVVVSTYDILREALDHAFVKLESLALIVFDEGMYFSSSAYMTKERITFNSAQLCWKASWSKIDD